MPHVSGQGSAHILFMQALSKGQSELIVHSGWQLGGLPMYSCKHEQTAWSLTSRHWLYGPHGDGTHGFMNSWTTAAETNEKQSQLEVGETSIIFLTRSWITWAIWITVKSWYATANGIVINDVANGVMTTYTRARIHTLVTNTSVVRGTIRIYDTFWSTTFVRIPEIIW